MARRAQAAVLLSVAAHVALGIGAMLVPVAVATGTPRVGSVTSTSTQATLEDSQARQGGFHGNTYDIDGFVDGELGRGAGASPAAQPERPVAPPTQPQAAPPAEAHGEPPVQPKAEPPPVPKAVPRETTPTKPAKEASEKRAKKPRKPKKKRRRRAKRAGARPDATPATSTPPATPSPSAGSDGGDGGADRGGEHGSDTGNGRQHGDEHAVPGRVNAAGAFTRAMAIAYANSRMWHDVALGEIGEAVVTLHVEDGRVTRTSIPKGTPKLLRKIIRGASKMTKLRKIQGDGITRLRVRLTLSMTDVPKIDDRGELAVLAAKNEAPTLDTPGGAFFTYGSGRHVRIAVSIAP